MSSEVSILGDAGPSQMTSPTWGCQHCPMRRMHVGNAAMEWPPADHDIPTIGQYLRVHGLHRVQKCDTVDLYITMTAHTTCNTVAVNLVWSSDMLDTSVMELCVHRHGNPRVCTERVHLSSSCLPAKVRGIPSESLP